MSLVLHSANPHLPTFRSDVRYFECAVRLVVAFLIDWWGRCSMCCAVEGLTDSSHFHNHHHATQGKGWFGGGADLTPYYLHDADVRVRA